MSPDYSPHKVDWALVKRRDVARKCLVSVNWYWEGLARYKARNPVNISLHLTWGQRTSHDSRHAWHMINPPASLGSALTWDTLTLVTSPSWPDPDTQFDTVSVFLSSCLPSLYYQYNLQRSLLLKTFYLVTSASLGLTLIMITSKHQLCNHNVKPSGNTALVLISRSFICNSRRNPAGGEVRPTMAVMRGFCISLKCHQSSSRCQPLLTVLHQGSAVSRGFFLPPLSNGLP